jgi:hypothetical protein
MFLFSISFELVSKSILLTSINAWTDVFISSRSFLAWACTGVRMELVWVSSQRFTSLEDENWRVVSVNDASLPIVIVGWFINFSLIY